MSASHRLDFCDACERHADDCACVRCRNCGVMFEREPGEFTEHCLACLVRTAHEESSDAAE